MKKSLTMLTMVAVAALVAAPVLAGEAVRVDVPFDFVAADQQLPAGEYQFVRGENPRVVQVISKAQGQVAILVTVVGPGATDEIGVTFLRLGDEYFLKTINGTQFAFSVPPCHAERMAQARRPAGTAVALSGR